MEPPKGEEWVQEEDTFDTWFSSGQWAYSTLGYPNGTDYKNYYPTDIMVMGSDILFFWAARMIMMSLYRTKKIPFKNLYFTGLVRDKDGYKMSKSRGNGIDPLEMVRKFGSDALRLSLVMNVAPGQDLRLYEEKIESFRNFVTKLWNIFRYAAGSDEKFELVEKISKRDLKTIPEKWIVSKLEETTGSVTDFMKKKNISLAQEKLRQFTWDDLADWYLEINKIEKNPKVLGYILNKILKLWHPFTPFVTEKIYKLAGGRELLMTAKWPESEKKFINEKSEKDFKDLQELVTKIRNARSSYHIKAGEVIGATGEKLPEKAIVEKLAGVKFSGSGNFPKKVLRIRTRKRIIELDVSGLIDIEKEASILEKEAAAIKNSITKTENLLGNQNFIQSARKDIVKAYKEKLKENKEKLKIQEELLKNLELLKKA